MGLPAQPMSGNAPAAAVEPLWHLVQGGATGRRHTESQDAFRSWADTEDGLPAVVAVADGHGSSRHFRSASGSRLAVEAACRVLVEILASTPPTLPEAEERLRTDAPGLLVEAWRKAVADHLNAHPFTPDETTGLERQAGAVARRDVVLDPVLAYGTTLLAVTVTEHFIFYLQLGDGDILEVSHEGVVARPVPPDARLIANQTTSLCMAEAAKYARSAFRRITDGPPALVMLATDGYANSYRTDEQFQKVGSDLLEFAQTGGLDQIRDALPGWLEETSSGGSGDDITVALLYHASALALRRPPTLVVPSRDPDEDRTVSVAAAPRAPGRPVGEVAPNAASGQEAPPESDNAPQDRDDALRANGVPVPEAEDDSPADAAAIGGGTDLQAQRGEGNREEHAPAPEPAGPRPATIPQDVAPLDAAAAEGALPVRSSVPPQVGRKIYFRNLGVGRERAGGLALAARLAAPLPEFRGRWAYVLAGLVVVLVLAVLALWIRPLA